jgi:exopolyphosphatase/guanosine-5'-triphosphate,3'-diphosphate pyrophosphatase
MRVAAIDIGTNTLLLLVAEPGPDGQLRAVVDECRFGRLGQGLDKSGRLHPDAIERSLALCREYRGRLGDARPERLAVVGTQALREAGNAADFIGPAEELLGARIATITGDREAELVYLSVARAFPELAAADLVVADVGGGSTEIICGRAGQVAWRKSVPIGAVRLSERHLTSDPPTAAQGHELISAVDQALADLDLPTGAVLVATAGTATTLATVEQKLRVYDPARVQGYRLVPASVDRLLARFLELTVDEKRHLVGLEPERADVIAGGVAIYARLVSRMQASSLVVSDRGVRWGLVHELAEA